MFKTGALIGLNSWTEINDLTGLEAEVQSLTKNEIEVEVFLKTPKVINIVGWENGNLVSKIYDTKTAEIVSETETEAEELQKLNNLNFGKFGLIPKKYWPNSKFGPLVSYINKYTKKIKAD